MKRIVLLSSAFMCAAFFAEAPAMTFPYGTEMTVRHQTTSPVEVAGFYQVPSVGDGMPTSDTVATSDFEMIDMDAVPAEMWDSMSVCAEGGQAALCMRTKEDGSLVWMGYSSGSWIELEGAEPNPGAWTVKMDFDYTQGTTLVKVRYAVRPGDSTGDFVMLHPAGADSPWMDTGIVKGRRMTSVEFYGAGDISAATAESGRRQGYAATTTVEDYRMDYSGVALDVVVGETWGVDTLVATVKDVDGKVKGEVKKSLSDAQGGKVRLDLSAYTKSGESYVYDLKLTGEYDDTPTTCEKGASQVDLFSMVDWFGFDGITPVKADMQGLTVSDGVLSPTDPGEKGVLHPHVPEAESSLTVVKAILGVPGAVPYWELSALPVVESQGALVMAQFGGSVGRSWAVWSAAANGWVVVSGTGVGTGNGSYEVRAEFDEISSVRSVRYSVKVGSDYVVLKDGQANEWFALPPAVTRLNCVSLAGGGGITSLEASYKALGPVPEVSVKDGKIELTSNTELDLAKSSLEIDRGYPVQNPPGKKFHLRWKDAKSGDATTKWAKVENGQLKAVAGAPANGLDSFESHVLGLDPEDAQSRPLIAAEQNAEPDTLVLKLPTVRQRDPSETGVAVRYCLVTSDDTSFATETTAQEVTNVLAGEGPTFTADLPSSGGKVRYYRVKIVMEK